MSGIEDDALSEKGGMLCSVLLFLELSNFTSRLVVCNLWLSCKSCDLSAPQLAQSLNVVYLSFSRALGSV